MNRFDPTVCAMSGARVNLSVGEECARRTRCPKPNGCGKPLSVRPTRGSSYKHPNPTNNPVATLPMHKVPA